MQRLTIFYSLQHEANVKKIHLEQQLEDAHSSLRLTLNN